eukprot:sb/3469393/
MKGMVDPNRLNYFHSLQHLKRSRSKTDEEKLNKADRTKRWKESQEARRPVPKSDIELHNIAAGIVQDTLRTSLLVVAGQTIEDDVSAVMMVNVCYAVQEACKGIIPQVTPECSPWNAGGVVVEEGDAEGWVEGLGLWGEEEKEEEVGNVEELVEEHDKPVEKLRLSAWGEWFLSKVRNEVCTLIISNFPNSSSLFFPLSLSPLVKVTISLYPSVTAGSHKTTKICTVYSKR